MAATVKHIDTLQYAPHNMDKIGRNTIQEIHRITFDSDATIEVPTKLQQITAVIGGVCNDVSAPAANILGTDRVISDFDNLTDTQEDLGYKGFVTVGATGNNSNSYDVMFIGYI